MTMLTRLATRPLLLGLWLVCGLAAPARTLDAGEPPTRHVLFISTDGLRWQEVFRGADDAMMNRESGGVPDAVRLTEEFGGTTPAERREKLMPFLWGEIAKKGQIHGNRDLGSLADVTNGHWFSYPGYYFLQAARRVDRWVQGLWEKAPARPEYRDRTTLLITTDHGCGNTPKDWTSHGESVPDSGHIWMAAMGPDTPALGERRSSAAVTQAQVAATIARLVGEDYRRGARGGRAGRRNGGAGREALTRLGRRLV